MGKYKLNEWKATKLSFTWYCTQCHKMMYPNMPAWHFALDGPYCATCRFAKGDPLTKRFNEEKKGE